MTKVTEIKNMIMEISDNIASLETEFPQRSTPAEQAAVLNAMISQFREQLNAISAQFNSESSDTDLIA